jgi:glutathione synthase/RimK-type ligase-like ATP-grasp enzyme
VGFSIDHVNVSIATCKTLPEVDPDEALLVRALEARGVRVRMLPWDAEEAAPGELVVLRSTWNYFEDVARFLAWIDRTARTTMLLNPSSVVAANVRKTYLGELEKRGVPIVPTAFLGSEGGDVDAIVRERGFRQIVVKPIVSAGSFSTQRFDVTRSCTEAQAFLDGMRREAMVQEFMPDVEGYGERAIVCVDGVLTHAVRKSPRFIGGAESVSEAVPIADDERALAERVLSEYDGLLYARVDVVRGPDGAPRLMELELVEPSLFLLQSEIALERLVSAIVRRAKS